MSYIRTFCVVAPGLVEVMVRLAPHDSFYSILVHVFIKSSPAIRLLSCHLQTWKPIRPMGPIFGSSPGAESTR